MELRLKGCAAKLYDDPRPSLQVRRTSLHHCGFDPTADSLHVGSLVALMTLKRFRDAGHNVLVLLGDTTAMIGDPSGKSEERKLLDRETIQDNCAFIRRQIQQILGDVKIVNNSSWQEQLSAVELLRGIGQHFTIHNMLARDCVRSRESLSYTEFSYMLLQAYDFAYLNRTQGIDMQIGGSDQWGNMMSGLDLCRIWNKSNVQCLTFPLLTKADGAKMGKTEEGTVWLSGARTYPYHFYQYWLNIDDHDTERCLKMLTELGSEEIEALEKSDRRRRFPQKKLAEVLTRLVHGEQGLEVALAATRIFFGDEFTDLNDGMLYLIFQGVPHGSVARSRLDGDGMPVVDALVAANLAKTKGQARRTVEQGGAYVNNRKLESIESGQRPLGTRIRASPKLRQRRKRLRPLDQPAGLSSSPTTNTLRNGTHEAQRQFFQQGCRPSKLV